MKKSRAKAEAGSDVLAITDEDADFLESIFMEFVAFNIGEERAIVAFSNSPEMRREISHERVSLPKCLAVLLVSKELKAELVEQRRLRWQFATVLICGRKLSRLILACFNIRLIERIDAEDRARNCRGDF